MAHRSEITDELQEISPELARLHAITPYRVPASYFDELAALILLRIKAETSDSAADELEALSPTLAGLKKSMPYSVPAGYFENLHPAIETKKETRVISLPFRKVFRYAAAAVVIGLITVAGWFMLRQPSVTSTGQYAATQDSAAQNKVQFNIAAISDNEIASFLDGNNFGNIDNLSIDISEDDVTLMLADVSDKELESYLQQQNPVKEKFN